MGFLAGPLFLIRPVYFGGRYFGGSRLIPSISPNKTRSGVAVLGLLLVARPTPTFALSY